MSSFGTHMLIGATGGLALLRVLPHLAVPVDLSTVPPMALLVGCVAGSAILATVADIDEPNSWISRRVHLAIGVLTMVLGAIGGYIYGNQQQVLRFHDPVAAAILSGVVGLVIGMVLLGPVLLRTIRRAAGGHRRLTHSLVLDVVFGGIAFLLWRIGQGAWALLPLALIWGQLLHVIGDVVTPAGVPLLWPLSTHDVRVLPKPFARYGEPLVAVVAVIVAWTLLRTA